MNTVGQQIFHDAMPCVGATVNIITTDGPAGRAGFTASAVCSVTDTPSALLVCLNYGASVWSVFNEDRTLRVNTLSAGQEPLSDPFGGKTPMEHHFVTARQQTGMTGCPQLEEALVPFDYRISQVVSVDTHDIPLYVTEAIHRHATPYGLAQFDRGCHALIRSVY